MDEAHFRPPRPARTARILTALTVVTVLAGVVLLLQVGWVAGALAVLVAAALAVMGTLLSRVELVVSRSGIEVVDITGRRRQAWVGTQQLVIDFARSRPLLEIDAPGPSQPYRSTLVLAGLERSEHDQDRERLEQLVREWAGPGVHLVVRQPGDRPADG